MQAFRLKKVDEERDIHLQAWNNLVVKSADKKGKPTYKNFTDFYDYEKRIKDVSGHTQTCEKTEKNNHLFLIANNLKNMRKEVNNG